MEYANRRQQFDDYSALFADAARRIRQKRKAGYRLAGNIQAESMGVRDQATPEEIARVRRQFGPRRSIHLDPPGEVAAILAEPERYLGGTLVVNGDICIDGDWDVREYAAVVVLGNCEVRGVLYQYETEPWFVVTGSLTAQNLVMAANLDVGGDLTVTELAEFESADGYTHVSGQCSLDTAVFWDMSLTCASFKAEHYVSCRPNGDRCLHAEEVHVDHWVVGYRTGAQLEAVFRPYVLTDHHMEGEELACNTAEGWVPALCLDHRDVVHMLGLPLIRSARR